MKFCKFFVSVVFCVFPVTVLSSAYYTGADAVSMVVDGSGDGTASPGGYQMKIGRRFTPITSIEAVAFFGGESAKFEYNFDAQRPPGESEKSAKVDHLFGVYGVFSQKLSGGAGFYAKLGLASINISGTRLVSGVNATQNNYVDFENSAFGLAFGTGINIGFSHDRAFMIEYMVYPDTKEVDSQTLQNASFNLGIKLRI